MTSKFFALPVGPGEAFLLQTTFNDKDYAILVDSGWGSKHKKHRLTKAIREHVGRLTHIDIVICTHDDKDHSGGFEYFLDSWFENNGTIGEFWLPARWAGASRDLIFEPHKLIQRLMNGAASVAKELSGDNDGRSPRLTLESNLRKLANNSLVDLSAEETIQQNDTTDRQEKVCKSLGINQEELTDAQSALEDSSFDIEETLNNFIKFGYFPFLFYDQIPRLHSQILANELFNDVKETTITLSHFLKASVEQTIPIRWFDFDLFKKKNEAAGGIKNLLEPVSSVEICGPKKEIDDRQLFLSLRLSKQNVESLVFYRPEYNNEPAVLFMADSRLAFETNKPKCYFNMPRAKPEGDILITAPHHGSPNNDEAYTVIENWISDPNRLIVVRNGNPKKIPDKFFKQHKRLCAYCKNCFSNPQPRCIEICSCVCGSWIWPLFPACPCP